MPEPIIAYSPRPDATPSAAARLAALRFVLECHERKKGTRPGAPGDGTKVKEDSADAPIIRR